MDVKLEKLPKSEVKLTIVVDDKMQSELEKKAAQELSTQMKVKGFREGNAPVDVIKKSVGPERFAAYLLDIALPEAYMAAIKQEGIIPMSRPKVEIKEDSPITFEASVAVKPEVEFKDIDKVKIKAPKIEVSKKELDEALDHLKKMHRDFKEVERKAKKGDRVEINFDGKDKDGKEIEGAKSENHPIVIGDGMFIPGFEDNLVGMSKDEEKEFTVKFPKDYHKADLQGAPVTFKVKVLKIEEASDAKIDEEFVEKILGEKKSPKELEAKIKHEIEHQKLHEAEAKQDDELFAEFLKKAKLEVSDILIEEELELLITDIKRDALNKGQSFEEFQKAIEEKEGKTIKEVYRERAEERVKLRFIIDHIIQTKDIKVEQKDIEEGIKAEIEKAPPYLLERVKGFYESEEGKRTMENQLTIQQIMDLFIERPSHDCDN
jgi:trigger factor